MNHNYESNACCSTDSANTQAASCCAPTSNSAPAAPLATADTQTEQPTERAPRQLPVAAPRYRTSGAEDRVTLQVELPGVAQADVALFVEDGVLHLDAKQSLASASEGVVRQDLEFRLTDFRGRWRLPENVDSDAISSRLRYGVLELTLPLKRPERRTIAVV
ncbi:MAG: Hsp20/alpha crystallin family protein [Planctomycetota bacterium]